MFADKKQNDFATQMDSVGNKHTTSLPILEFWAALHNELNRESQYFEILIKLFDVYLQGGNAAKAAETIERLVDIDPYDHRNQERIQRLRRPNRRCISETHHRASRQRHGSAARRAPRTQGESGSGGPPPGVKKARRCKRWKT